MGEIAENYNLILEENPINLPFYKLIKKLCEKQGESVVVLIDDYSKPILDNIEKPEVAREIQEGLINFYCVLKEANPYLKFVFLTGVSKFSMASVFSELNNLEDITISPSYATICGYTREKFESVFADRL